MNYWMEGMNNDEMTNKSKRGGITTLVWEFRTEGNYDISLT